LRQYFKWGWNIFILLISKTKLNLFIQLLSHCKIEIIMKNVDSSKFKNTVESAYQKVHESQELIRITEESVLQKTWKFQNKISKRQ